MNIAEKYSRQAGSTIGESSRPPKEDSAAQTPPVAPQITLSHVLNSRKKKSWALWGIVAVLVLILMAVTCPSQKDHQERISQVFKEYMHRQLEDTSDPMDAFDFLGVGDVVDYVMGKMVTVDKYLIFSVGTINYPDGGKNRISFGILSRVYTFDVDDLTERLNNAE